MSASAAHHLPEAVLRPVRGHHAFEACVEQLATTIRLGVYPLGSTLPSERELAHQAQRLPGDPARGDGGAAGGRTGRDQARPRRRHRGHAEAADPVRRGPPPGSPQSRRRDWLDALEFRRIVEPGAAQLAAAPAASRRRRRDQLEQALAEVSGARRPADHRQADSRFHLTVAALTGSPRVIEAVTRVQATLHEMLLAIPVLEANIAHSDRQHAALVRAILAGQSERARRVMEEHCDDTAALLRGLVG